LQDDSRGEGCLCATLAERPCRYLVKWYCF
jgi:hypothetical protein